MRTYNIQLLKCNGKDQKISAYLQILTGLDKVTANRIVSNLPAVLFDNLDEEGMEYYNWRRSTILRRKKTFHWLRFW